jgi:hypothetical protein
MFLRIIHCLIRKKPERQFAIGRSRKRLGLERLECRSMFAGLPFGAAPDDTAEFMLGRIAVTPVFLESNGQIDPSTENWTPTHRAAVLSNIQTGIDWWERLLATKSSLHTLDFVIDTTYVDNPVPTPYEPIARNSNAYVDWVSRFLVDVGFDDSAQIEPNIRAFNHSQRTKHNADWAFTIFVVNSQNDLDGNFAPGGTFDRAFAFAGGLFEVVPSTRPASTFTHETGHMFWARDEYIGGGNYSQRRGYYNAQNTNAIDLNPNPAFVQEDSIMSSGLTLDRAYQNLTTSAATLAHIGWVDSDSDGIFDVLDVPLKLEGLGQLNGAGTHYVFTGRALVQTLPNANSSGLQNDITINRVGRIEYRFNNGNWQTWSSPNQYQIDLSMNIPVPNGMTGTIEIRAIESTLGITSNTFSGSIGPFRDTAAVPGIQGFVWNDQNRDGQWQSSESGIPNTQVRLVDNARQPITLRQSIEPDAFPEGQIATSQSGYLIEAIGDDTNGNVGVFVDLSATTGSKVFRPYSTGQLSYIDGFRGEQQKLKITFASPTTMVSIDAVAANNGAVARLDAYNSNGKIIRRFQSPTLNNADRVTMQVSMDTSEIAYVVARGIRNHKIKLDNLQVGPSTETQTKSDGSFVLVGIPAGNYQLEATTSASYRVISPTNAIRSTSLAAGQALSHVDFGAELVISQWQNPVLRHDVNNDGLISPLDALVVINEINRSGARVLTGTTLAAPPYYDVNGNREIEALDVLVVINFLNANPASGEGELGLAVDWMTLDEEIVKRRSTGLIRG